MADGEHRSARTRTRDGLRRLSRAAPALPPREPANGPGLDPAATPRRRCPDPLQEGVERERGSRSADASLGSRLIPLTPGSRPGGSSDILLPAHLPPTLAGTPEAAVLGQPLSREPPEFPPTPAPCRRSPRETHPDGGRGGSGRRSSR